MPPIADIDCPQDWQRTAHAVAREGGVTVVLGGVDTGKSTLCRYVAHCCITQGRTTAILDADLGQSWIGPPTTVGFALVEGAGAAAAGLEPAGMWFVGATSPQGHMLQTAVGVRRVAEAARRGGADAIIVDTSGWIDGPAARALKEAKIALLRPRHIIGIQVEDEVQHLIAPYEHREGVSVHTVHTSRRVRPRDMARRRQHRERQFRDYFAGGRELALPLGRVALLGTSLLSGTTAPAHVRSYAEELLGVECFHAEMMGERLVLVCEHYPERGALGTVREQFPDDEVTVFALRPIRGALAGLADAREQVLGLGIVADVDFGAKELRVVTPVPAADDVAAVTIGTLRLQGDFTELGPAEVRWP
ncbi:MAG: Clp1/GlmU family protein [Armatimonadota bacterium]|jgi:polynucleotide 5'-hydroxyl-kinase GRC3/NOL9